MMSSRDVSPAVSFLDEEPIDEVSVVSLADTLQRPESSPPRDVNRYSKIGEPSQDDLVHTLTRPVSLLTSIQRAWWAEILMTMVALLALCALIAVLRKFDGQPLPELPYGVSLNAVGAVLAIVLKGSMMLGVSAAISQLQWARFASPRPLRDITYFDNASRGIWGSILLICRLPGLHLVILGAVITILTVAIDPFVQQIIRYQPCDQPINIGIASIARSNLYNITGSHLGARLDSLDLPMQAAIYKEAYNASSDIQPICTTGNCTFPMFRTAAVCSSCLDASSHINMTADLNATYTHVWSMTSDVNLTFQDGRMLSIGPADAADLGSSLLSSTFILAATRTTYTSLGSYDPFISQGKTDSLLAMNCSLSPCIRTYDASLAKGQLTETLLSKEPMPRSKEFVVSYLSAPMPCLINGTYYDEAYFRALNKTGWLRVPDQQMLYVPQECLFSHSFPDGLSQYLARFLAGFTASAPEVDFSSPDWVGRLYNAENATMETVSAFWERLADAMTIRIREAGDETGSTAVLGQTWHTQVCLQVQWAWVTFPAALIVSAMGFLGLAIGHGAGQPRRHVWESSLLPLLFHGPERELRDQLHDVENKISMTAVAKNLIVKLDRDRNGHIAFVQVDRVS